MRTFSWGVGYLREMLFIGGSVVNLRNIQKLTFFDAKQLLFFYLDTQNILGTLSTGEVEHEVAGDLRAIST